MARLLEEELASRQTELEKACAAANEDLRLAEVVDEWQAFDDVPAKGRPSSGARKGTR